MLAFACVLAGALTLPGAAGAQSFVVDTAGDSALLACATPVADGDCSLRSAIIKANLDSVADEITFSATTFPGPAAAPITIGIPLPPVTEQLKIDASGKKVYVAGGYICGSSYALDITAATALKPMTVKQLPFNDVCGLAIRSNVPAPTIAVGPRHADDSVAVSGGTATDATSVDVFSAKLVTNEGEADAGGFIAAVSAANGFWAFHPPTVPTSADVYAATATTPIATSNFSTRAHTPADLISPLLNNVVAVSNSRVRLDFNESFSGCSAVPAAYALGMANVIRPIAGASVDGNSVYLDSSLPWGTGEAGAISLTGNGRVIDAAGNELLGLPTAPVYAGPGELDAPVISNFKLSPNRFCQRISRKCKRGSTWAYISLNKPARVIFKVARGTTRRSELVTFVHRLGAGKNKFKFDAVVSGRTLPATVLTIRAIAEDVARTRSAPVDTPFKIVKSKGDL